MTFLVQGTLTDIKWTSGGKWNATGVSVDSAVVHCHRSLTLSSSSSLKDAVNAEVLCDFNRSVHNVRWQADLGVRPQLRVNRRGGQFIDLSDMLDFSCLLIDSSCRLDIWFAVKKPCTFRPLSHYLNPYETGNQFIDQLRLWNNLGFVMYELIDRRKTKWCRLM